jgi:hypothetical protein
MIEPLVDPQQAFVSVIVNHDGLPTSACASARRGSSLTLRQAALNSSSVETPLAINSFAEASVIAKLLTTNPSSVILSFFGHGCSSRYLCWHGAIRLALPISAS